MIDAGANAKLERLRAVCRACPVAGECLQAAFDMPASDRVYGPVRVGLSGPAGWRRAEVAVEELAPSTADDWAAMADLLLEPFVLHARPVRRARQGSVDVEPARRRVVELLEHGWSRGRIARAAGIGQATVSRLAGGVTVQTSSEVAGAVLAVALSADTVGGTAQALHKRRLTSAALE